MLDQGQLIEIEEAAMRGKTFSSDVVLVLMEIIAELEENATAQALALKAAKAMQQAETARADKAEADCNHWKANHENQVLRARILMERQDMPIERVKAYRRMQELEALSDELFNTLNFERGSRVDLERDAKRYRYIRTKERMMLETDDGEARMTTTFSSADEFDDAIDQVMNNL